MLIILEVMSNHDLVLGERGDMPMVQNQHLGLSHNHNLVMGGLGQSHEHDLDIGRAGDNDLGLEDGHDRELLLDHEIGLPHGESQGHGHENEYHPHDEGDTGYDHRDDNGTGYDHENSNGNVIDPGGEDGHDIDPDDTGMDHHDHQMVVSDENHGLDLSENHDLTIVENHELDDNLDLDVHQNHNMDMSQLVVTTPIMQNRTLVPAPTYELTVGQEFPDVKSCRRALRDCAIALHFEIQTVKSDKTRFTAKCASDGCPWRIHAAKLPGTSIFCHL